MADSNEIKKLYYAIREVSELTGVKQYVLRYWEGEFDVLKPLKNRSGNRAYTAEDIENILKIKQLLHVQKYTIEGAKQVLKEPRSGSRPDDQVRKIKEIRRMLELTKKELG